MSGGTIHTPSSRPAGLDPSVSYIPEERRRRDGGPTDQGGGGDPPDDMDKRIAKLEAGHEAIRGQLSEMSTLLKVIDTKLDAKAAEGSVSALDGKVQNVKDAINTRASQADFNLLKGSVQNLPTTWQIIGPLAGLIFVTLTGVAVLAFTIAKLIQPATGH